jgi:hypothetical protein
MGGVRVMVLTNTRPESENDASHVLMFAEAPQYSPSQAATPAAEPSQPKPARRRAQRGGEKQQIDDDPVPF